MFLYIKYLFFIFFVYILFGCTDINRSDKVLKEAGFVEIHYTKYSYFSCGNNYFFHTGFQAKSFNGDFVFGTVCCGLYSKGCKIVF